MIRPSIPQGAEIYIVHVHICTHTLYICMYAGTCTCIYTHECTHMHTHICTHTYTHTYKHINTKGLFCGLNSLTGCSAMNCCSGTRSSASERTFLAMGGAISGLISGAMLTGGKACNPPTVKSKYIHIHV